MALDGKKSGFKFDIEGRVKRSVQADTDTVQHEYAHTDTDTDADVEPPENRSKRAYLLFRPSVWEWLTKYGKAHHRSNNDIINELVEKFMEDQK